MITLKQLKTPVPDDFFNPPPLSPDKIEELRAVGYRAQRDLLEYTKLTGGQVEWTLRTTDANVKIYSAGEGNLPLFLGTAEIQSTLDEMRGIMTAPTTADARRVNDAYFPDVLDEVRLYLLSTPTEDRPNHFSFVSWLLHRSPLQGRIVRNRDICCVMHLDDIEIDGKKACLGAYKSVALPACPDLEEKYGVVRADFIHFGFIFMETDKPGVLQMKHLEHVDPNGQVNGDIIGGLLMYKMTESQYNAMSAMQANVYAHRLSRVSYLPLAAYVNKHSRTKCAVCLKKFGAFARKSNCRRCGEVVCSKVCSAKYKVAMAVLIELRVCSRCIPEPNEVEQEMPWPAPMNKALPEVMSSSSSGSSNPSYPKESKKTQRSLTMSTQSELVSNVLSDDMLTLSSINITEIFQECNDRIERDDDVLSESNVSFIYDAEEGGTFDISNTNVSRIANYFGSPVEAPPRRREDIN
ncbi:unnamed protein product [Aphanomyces euteiches]